MIRKILAYSFFVLVIGLVAAGCGGGGGGGANPVAAPVTTGSVANLTGVVTLENVPLANAKVFLYPSQSAYLAGIAQLGSVRANILQQTLNDDGSYSTFTDATGRYSFTGIPVGNYTLIAARDQSHQFAKTNVILGAVTQQDAQLTPTGSVTGRVQMMVDATTENIPGAIVYLDGTSYVAVSGLDGTYTISNVPANQSFTVKVVSSKGAATTSPTVTVTPGTSYSAPTIMLAAPDVPTSVVSGQIAISGVSAPDAELAGHMVLLTSQDQTPLINLTDENGNYSFIVRAGGDYRITPIPEEYDSIPLFQTVNVTLGQNTSPSQTFTLQADQQGQVYFFVEGSLTKTEKAFDEADEAGVPITLTETGSQRTFATVSIPDGSFNFEVPAGEYELAVGGGYALETPLAVNPFTVSGQHSIPAFNIVPTRNVVLVQGTIIKTSKVMGESDESGVALILTSADSVTYPSVTDASGNFSFFVPNGTYELSTGGVYQFENHPFGGSPLVVPLSTAQQTILASPINVAPMGVGQQMALVQGQISKLAKAFGETDEGGVTLTLTTTDATVVTYSAVSAPDGSFSFSVPLGEYSFAVSGSYKLVTDPLSGSPLNVTGDYYFDPIEVGPHQEMVQVQGSVAKQAYAFDETDDHSGVNITLSADDASGNVYSAISDVNGYFSFDIPSGTYKLSIGGNYKLQTTPHPDVVTNDPVTYISTPISVIPSAELFNVVGIISKTATVPQDPSGTNPVTVILRSADNSYEAITSDNGDFAFKVKAGTYNIELSGPYVFDTVPAALVINADEDYGTLNVSPSTMISAVLGGTITPASIGEPFQVRLWDVDNTQFVATTMSTKTLTGYNYRFNDIPQGTYRVIAFPDKNGYFAETPSGSPVTLAAGDSLLTHDLAAVKIVPLITGLTAAGNLVDLVGTDFTGAPPAPAETRAYISGNVMPRPLSGDLTATSDRFDISDIAPGDYLVELRRTWTYIVAAGISETFVLKSNTAPLSKPIQPPSNLVMQELTDTKAKFTWRNAPWTQATDIEIYNVTDSIVFNNYPNVPENFFEVTGLAPDKTYEVRLQNKAGNKISAIYNAPQFTTKKASDYQIQTISLVNSGNLLSNGTVLDFMSANDTYYVLHTITTDLYVSRYDSITGAELGTTPIFASAAAPSRDQASMAYGGGLIFIAYSDQTDVIVNAYNPADLTTPVGTRTLAGYTETQMIYAGGALFLACSSYASGNTHDLIYFDNPGSLTGNAPQTVETWSTSGLSNSSNSYLAMVAADANNLYFAYLDTSGSTYDTCVINKYSLSDPMLGYSDLFTLDFTPGHSMYVGITQFKEFQNHLFARVTYGNSPVSHRFYFVDSNSGYVDQKLSLPFSVRGDLGVDSKGRIWMGESQPNVPSGKDFFVQTNLAGDALQTIKVENGFVNVDNSGGDPFPSPANFIKLDPVSNSMNMLFKDGSEALSVYRYSSEY